MKFRLPRTLQNASWMVGSKIVQMMISLIVSMLTARYLGPSNYGLINYAGSYVSFFLSFCDLGIKSILVREYIHNPDRQGETTGTTLGLQLVSSIISIIVIFCTVSIIDRNEPITIWVCALHSLKLIFHVFDNLCYWFQARQESKYPAIASVIALVITSAYKIFLLATGKSILWFALSVALDNAVVAAFLFIIYKKKNGQRMTFSWIRARELLSQSYHFILSGLMITIYGQTDKIMLKQMLDSSQVGYYSTATTLCSLWTFVLVSILDAFRPDIIETHKIDHELYLKKLRRLFSVIFYICISVSFVMLFAAKPIVSLVYGKAYLSAVPCLQVVSWYTAFSYMGGARTIWVICENKQKWLKYINILSAIVNVILNFIFIPIWGGVGAALASLITQICTSIVIPLFFKDMRESSKLMLDGIFLRNLR